MVEKWMTDFKSNVKSVSKQLTVKFLHVNIWQQQCKLTARFLQVLYQKIRNWIASNIPKTVPSPKAELILKNITTTLSTSFCKL